MTQPQPSVREKAREMYIQLETYDSFFAGLSADEEPLCWVKYMDKVVMPFIDQIITLAQEEQKRKSADDFLVILSKINQSKVTSVGYVIDEYIKKFVNILKQ